LQGLMILDGVGLHGNDKTRRKTEAPSPTTQSSSQPFISRPLSIRTYRPPDATAITHKQSWLMGHIITPRTSSSTGSSNSTLGSGKRPKTVAGRSSISGKDDKTLVYSHYHQTVVTVPWCSASSHSKASPNANPSSIVLEAITTLEIESCGLRDLSVLPESMVNLRWASFRDNQIRNVARLAHFTKLEELSLEGNCIQSVDALGVLPLLARLDASNNQIASINVTISAGATNAVVGQHQQAFRSLCVLGLERNCVRSLKGFARMGSLMEFCILLSATLFCAKLFETFSHAERANDWISSLTANLNELADIGNNQISDLYSIFPLKELPRLIIIDLDGNPVSRNTNHRLFTIFHLARLKILDGTSITPKEQTQAKEVYLGKLTMELLGEKIGHFSFKNIVELDLRNCKIKEIDCFRPLTMGPSSSQSFSDGIPQAPQSTFFPTMVSNTTFRNLRRLNFDNNLLTNIDPLTSLTSLRSLSLNHNRIERLLSTDQPVSTVGISNICTSPDPYSSSPSLSGPSTTVAVGAGEDVSSGVCAGGMTGGTGTEVVGEKAVTTNGVGTSSVGVGGAGTVLLPFLEELHLGNNVVTRIADLGLHRLPQLKLLYLHGNRITKVMGRLRIMQCQILGTWLQVVFDFLLSRTLSRLAHIDAFSNNPNYQKD
ncbi:hypothetical protein HK102_003261, partial [Quaeritorhiza haematococci]